MSKISRNPKHLFVYGTLRDDAPNRNRALVNMLGKKIGQGVTLGQLYDLGSYPGMLPGDKVVSGQVFEIADEHLPLLDRYEGVPRLYRREAIRVSVACDLVKAWAYVFNQPLPNNAKLIESGDYLRK